MRRDLKKKLAILLAASLVMSMNTAAFAEEVPEDVAIEETQSAGSDAEVSEFANVDSEEIAAEIQEESKDKKSGPVISIKEDPTTWSKDPSYARYTYGRFLPELYDFAGEDYNDRDMVSTDMILNGHVITQPAKDPADFPILLGVSFNCIPVQSGTYLIYAYGIRSDDARWGGATTYGNSEELYRRNVVSAASTPYPYNVDTPSQNNYFGMTPDDIPAGVFDYTNFTWFDKDGGSAANGKIIFEAAVINWTTSGTEATKNRYIKVEKLQYKNNKFATVSFDASPDGHWIPIKNKFQKETKQPQFWPVFKYKNTVRDYMTGEKVKVTSETKKLKKTLNSLMKNNKILFEIRRRPMASTVSWDYLYGNDWQYTSLMGDELDFKSSGTKLKNGTLQFKSMAYVKERDGDTDDVDKEADAGSANTSAQIASYRLTHVLKMTKIKSSETETAGLADKIKAGEFHFKTKTDSWYKVKPLGTYDSIVVYGANNMEGTAIFRRRKDKTVGKGYYNDDKDYFVTGEEDTAEVE